MSFLEKKKCRRYSVEYLAFGFLPAPRDHLLPMRLLCMCSFSNESMKPCKLKKHLINAHTENKDKPLEYFLSLRDSFKKRGTLPQIIGQCSQELDKGTVASYKISKLIAQTGNAHNVGESLILPSVSIIMSDVMNLSAKDTVQAIPLSNSTVWRRLEKMAHDAVGQLVSLLQSKKFSLQIDETTLQDNDALLMAYVRLWNANTLMEEMFFARRIRSDTKGLTMFEEIRNYFNEKNIPFQNLIACATDGAASVIGRYRGFTGHLKAVLLSVFTIHCVIHREHLGVKEAGSHLNPSLSVVVQVVNYIKSQALQNRLFHQLCEENNEDFDTLLLHTEVRWLSRGNCLQHFGALSKTIVAFMSDKECGDKLIEAKADVFYLADIFEKFNFLNRTLQGRDNNFMDSKMAVVSFLKNLEVYWHNIGRREFLEFSNLKTIAEEVKDDDLLVYVNHLKQIQKDMEERFHDLLNLHIPDWIADPFEVSALEVETEIQESLINPQNDTSAGRQFNHSGKEFWVKNDLPNKFPTLWEKVQTFFIAFPSTYLVECGFSKVVALTKSRNRMDVAARANLRLSLSNMEPDIVKLAKKCQPQGSH
uniref:HAT C-terminal dimerisation domain-containing protein n=1 Tax=Trichuris muris TaxID=70415 RepID=A0A5S6Q6L0_TRIMR